MKSISLAVMAVIVSTMGTTAHGTMPPIPPNTNGDGNTAHNGMKHALVSQHGAGLSIHVADTPPAPVTMMSGIGSDYTPDKFAVLESVYFNAQYGWLPDGFFSLPADTSIWIERTAASQPVGATFLVYEAGNMSEGMATWTMNEVYSHDGARWQWDGLMQHDYFTADLPGEYAMTFRVYVGDHQGVPRTDFEAAETTFFFRVVPEPTYLGWLFLIPVAWGQCRRRSVRMHRG